MIARKRDRRRSCGSADCNIWGFDTAASPYDPPVLTGGYYIHKQGVKTWLKTLQILYFSTGFP